MPSTSSGSYRRFIIALVLLPLASGRVPAASETFVSPPEIVSSNGMLLPLPILSHEDKGMMAVIELKVPRSARLSGTSSSGSSSTPAPSISAS
jgi:hypothetical protein